MNVYQSNPDAPPDSDFETGAIKHLVGGNRGRLFDPRRTPISIVRIKPETGIVVLRIEDFEDRGALWEIPLEDISKHYQFTLDSQHASADDIRRIEDAIIRFDRTLSIPCDPEARTETNRELQAACEEADNWLDDHSAFLASGSTLPEPELRQGESRLFDDLNRYMTYHDLLDIEEAFAKQYVCNPYSGELVKGHRIVIAEMGLVPFEGKIVRDPAIFEGTWSKTRRRQHIMMRLAFLRALFAHLDHAHVILYRGFSTTKAIQPPRNDTFIPSTFSRLVAESHFNVGDETSTRALFRQSVPIQRLFMTYLETEQMNRNYKEAEAILLWSAENKIF